VHKTEVGGVRLDLRNADDVARAFAELGRLRSQAPELRVLVQPHLRGGAETILGAYRDPEYGPLISFGLGGIFAEALGDVQLRVAPLTDHDAREMVRGLKAFRVLQGERGQPPADLAALEDALLRLSTLIVEQEAIAELDLNPFLAAPAGGRSLALDARILRG
jgi:acetyltransferase